MSEDSSTLDLPTPEPDIDDTYWSDSDSVGQEPLDMAWIQALDAWEFYMESDDIPSLERSVWAMLNATDSTATLYIPNRLDVCALTSQARFRQTRDIYDLEAGIHLLRSAIILTPYGDPNRPGRLRRFSLLLSTRFGRLSEPDDWEKAVSLQRLAIALVPNDYHAKSLWRSGLGNMFLAQFKHLHELKDLETALFIQRYALRHLPAGHNDRSLLLNNYGNTLRLRFLRLKEEADIEMALSMYRLAIDLMPNTHPDRPRVLGELGSCLLIRFESFGNTADLERSLSMQRLANEMTAHGDPHKPTRLDAFGNAARRCYFRLGDPQDIENAIDAQRLAVGLTPNNHPNKPGYLSNLAYSFTIRFERLNRLSDLDTVIALRDFAADLVLDDDKRKAPYLSTVADVLLVRYQRLNDVHDLDSIISVQAQAAEATSDEQKSLKASRLHDLGNSLRRRFMRSGNMHDIADAIDRLTLAVEITPDARSQKHVYLANLAFCFSVRYEKNKQLEDIDRVISLRQSVCELVPDGNPGKPELLGQLCRALDVRCERTAAPEDINSLISVHQHISKLTDGSPDNPIRLTNFGNYLLLRYRRSLGTFKKAGDYGSLESAISDLERAISQQRRAVKLTPDGHAQEPSRLDDLGNSLRRRYMHSGGLEDIENAIAYQTRAVGATLLGSDPNKTVYMHNLAISFWARFEQLDDIFDLHRAIALRYHAVGLVADSNPRKVSYLDSLLSSMLVRSVRLRNADSLDGVIDVQTHIVNLMEKRPNAINPSEYSSLGDYLLARFKIQSETQDLDNSIYMKRKATSTAPDDLSAKILWLNHLGDLLRTRYELTRNSIDLEDSLAAQHSAVVLASHLDHRHGYAGLSNLGETLSRRCEDFPDLGDWDSNSDVSLLQLAAELAPDRHPDKYAHLGSLGNTMLRRYGQSRQPDDLMAALAELRSVLKTESNGHTDRTAWVHDFGSALRYRLELNDQNESVDAISEDVDTLQKEVFLLSDDLTKSAQLGNLGFIFWEQFRRSQVLDYLNHAIAALSTADELALSYHPAQLLNELCNALRKRFRHNGDIDDLHTAIARLEQAISSTEDSSPHKPALLSNLGKTLRRRFEVFNRLEDIEKSISLLRQAADLTPDGDSNQKFVHIGNLANSLLCRYERLSDFLDLEQAIAMLRYATDITPHTHPDKPAVLISHGASLMKRFDKTNKLDDLSDAISVMQQAVDLTPDGHLDKPSRLRNLGNALRVRFKHAEAHNLDDLENAILKLSHADQTTPDNHPDKPLQLTSLGGAWGNRFGHSGRIDDLNESIRTQQQAVQLAPEHHPYKPMWRYNLSIVLQRRFELDKTSANFYAIVDCLTDAAASEHGPPSIRLKSAVRCVKMYAKHPTYSTLDVTLKAYSHILNILPEIVWLGHDIRRRYDESAKLGELVNAAVAAAIDAEALSMAVEWLEAGRSLIWSQILSLRTPLDDLEEHHPVLAQTLRAVQLQLQNSGHFSFTADSPTDDYESAESGILPVIATNKTADRHRKLAIEYENILGEVRRCEGFETFLRPKTLAELMGSSTLSGSTIVFINVHPSRCDALILASEQGPTSVRLPDLTLEDARTLRQAWTTQLKDNRLRRPDTRGACPPQETRILTRALEHTWLRIVLPVLEALDFTDPIDECLPHIVWCPTGPLAQLPLHAAGLYDDPHGQRVYDYVVSSYTPSLSAFVRCRRKTDKAGVVMPEMLIVTQPHTPQQSPLPGTEREGARLQQILSESQEGIPSVLLNDKDATVDAVRSVINKYPWIHLACHGWQHGSDATRSAFFFVDGSLTLSNLMSVASKDAEFAFLSACQTAVGDDNTPEESVHLAAGMLVVGFRGVVATTWSIQDADAPILVEAFYEELLALRRAKALKSGTTGAAYALHKAVRCLRNKVGEDAFMRWAPFVHFGV